MKMRNQFFWTKTTLLLVVHCTWSIVNANAQAWTKDQGKAFVKADVTSIQADQLFDNSGNNIKPAFFPLGYLSAGIYGEYGVSNDVTVFGNIPLFVKNTLSKTALLLPEVSNSGFGDIDLGVRYQLYKGDVAVSLNLILGLPTGNAKNADKLNTGDGEFNQILKLAVGTGKDNWWTQGAIGFNNRSGNFSSEFRYDLEVGWKLFNKKLLAMLKINAVESLNNGTELRNPYGLFSNDVGYIGIGPEFLYYATPKMGIAFRATGALKGRNVQAAPAIAFGVFLDL
jgi:hypothetical protein